MRQPRHNAPSLTLSRAGQRGPGRARRLLSLGRLLWSYGAAHCLRLFGVLVLMPVAVRIAPFLARLYLKGVRVLRRLGLGARLRLLDRQREELVQRGRRGYRAGIEVLGLEPAQLDRLRREGARGREVVVAEIDQDGFLLSHFGPLRAPTVSEDRFLPRTRFRMQVVARGGVVGVRKDYQGDRAAFDNEVRALDELGRSGCNVPAVLDLDVERLVLTLSYIPGPVVREELARKGARLRDRDHVDEADGAPQLSFRERVEEGRKLLYEVVDEAFVDRLFSQLVKLHAARFILADTKYGNIIIERGSGEPFLIDFEGSLHLPGLGPSGTRGFRDTDIEMFNLHFNTAKPTYARLRAMLREPPWSRPFYAPVYLGAGLRVGPIWRRDTGYGRWHYILRRNLPSMQGKRILDLGANNGFNSLQMLREGAREAVAVEQSPEFMEHGRFLKEAFEWVDSRRYAFRYVSADMARLPELKLGRFDLAMALCSIYYLEEADIVALIRHLSEISDMLVLQCNTETGMRRQDPDTFRKASLEFTREVMRANGFPEIEVIAPRGYTRPLVLGRKGSGG